MATHSAAQSVGNWPRKFTINRRNGQQAKDGRPFFFEWLKEIPETNDDRRIFETRTGGDGSKKHYELFSGIEGYFTGLEKVVPAYAAEKEEHLILKMQDVDEKYEIDLGSIDGRYSMNFMSRVLNEKFNRDNLIKVSPYAVENKETGKTNMGVALICGGEKIDSRRNDTFENFPEPNTYTVKGQKKYDFSPVSDFLWKEVSKIGNQSFEKESRSNADSAEYSSLDAQNKKSLTWLSSQIEASEGDQKAILHACNTVWKKVKDNTLSLRLEDIAEVAGISLMVSDGKLTTDDLPF